MLVVIDLDGFKELNDSRGHQAGDEVLRTFGRALRANAREDDIVARTGGDEFVLIPPATEAAGAYARMYGRSNGAPERKSGSG